MDRFWVSAMHQTNGRALRGLPRGCQNSQGANSRNLDAQWFSPILLLLVIHTKITKGRTPFRKGISQSALPYRRSVPSWLKLNAEDVKEQIKKLGKKGMTPSKIGIILRDSHGVAQVRFINGNKILRIMKSVGLKPDIPEDLYYLIKKAVAIRKHLERNRKDKDSKFRLILIESRIHRLARYYKTKSVLPPNWKYESSTASALVA